MPASPRLPLASEAEHAVARAEWEAFFAEIAAAVGVQNEWVDWLNTCYENCIPSDDSFTVLSKKRADAPVGFSLHLCLPEASALPVHSYWRLLGEGMLDTPIRHFVVSCETDSSSVAEAKKILMEWLLSYDKTA
jgi:hypothetical protein